MICFNSLHATQLFMLFFCRLLAFFKIDFFKNAFKNTIRVTNSLDPDQDLGPSCFQRLSAGDKSRRKQGKS